MPSRPSVKPKFTHKYTQACTQTHRKERMFLFNNALNTFYLRLYGIRPLSDRGNLLPPHGLLFPISSKGSFICIIPDRITHTMAIITPVVEHRLE